MKSNFLNRLLAIGFIALLATGCSSDIEQVKPGEMVWLGWTSNFAIGTDSTIIIMDRNTGEILQTINRKGTCR